MSTKPGTTSFAISTRVTPASAAGDARISAADPRCSINPVPVFTTNAPGAHVRSAAPPPTKVAATTSSRSSTPAILDADARAEQPKRQ